MRTFKEKKFRKGLRGSRAVGKRGGVGGGCVVLGGGGGVLVVCVFLWGGFLGWGGVFGFFGGVFSSTYRRGRGLGKTIELFRDPEKKKKACLG